MMRETPCLAHWFFWKMGLGSRGDVFVRIQTVKLDFWENVLSHVMKLGGDNGKLDSDALYFETERLLVSAEARDHIGRYFTRVDLTDPKNADPWVCVGTAKILEPSV
eukprot:m.196042 g.196042  ORF g.196042 m.196042 type:complete len:107 (-) comp18317_c1_seq5:186-506(-)